MKAKIIKGTYHHHVVCTFVDKEKDEIERRTLWPEEKKSGG